MASIDDELLRDEEENRREIAFIRERLPLDTKEKFTDEQMQWMLDTIVDYYVTSGILDSDAEELDIDMEQVTAHVCDEWHKEFHSKLAPQEIFFIVEADLDFQEEG